MPRHFGVLSPSTNTTVEIEWRLLPATYQAHVGRLKSSGGGSFSPSRDEDIDYQSHLLGTAKVEMVILAQTSASLFAEDYDEVVTKRRSAGAGVPSITSAQAVGRAVRALGARRVAIVSPYSEAVNDRAARYFQAKHGLDTIALEGFGATDAYAIGQLGPQNARDAFARIDRPERGLRGARGQFPDDVVARRLGTGIQEARGDDQPGVALGDAARVQQRRPSAGVRPPAR